MAVMVIGQAQGMTKELLDGMLANLAERTRTQDAMKRENIDLFTRNVEKGQVLEMQNASHYIFQSNQSEVLDAIEKFVSQLP